MTHDESKGHIYAEYWMLCGLCGRETALDARKRRVAIEEARERGWVRTREHGWVCSECKRT
ncbi:MAG: hypothetical protein ACR2JC_20685 [Chloroflexota bacterium]|nr:MAG: hypothetical protein DLM70_04935 [Chloroflexota bacterium]